MTTALPPLYNRLVTAQHAKGESMSLDPATMERLEAAAFRRLVDHLQQRTDAQNIDLMGLAGFCRNCLGDWLHEAAAETGVELSKEAGRELVYGMPAAEFKAKHQTPATPEQMARMEASLAKNEAYRAARGGR
jgi:hypothetical protein